jgi:hypothetical protein
MTKQNLDHLQITTTYGDTKSRVMTRDFPFVEAKTCAFDQMFDRLTVALGGCATYGWICQNLPLISTPTTFSSIITMLTCPCVAAAESGDWPATQIFTSNSGAVSSHVSVTAWCNDVDGLECLP